MEKPSVIPALLVMKDNVDLKLKQQQMVTVKKISAKILKVKQH